MTKDEIKKALEICKPTFYNCRSCAYNDVESCIDASKADALNLIIEQEKEIAQLKAENVRLTTKLGQVLLSIDTVKEMNAMCNIDEQRKRVVKEFAKKVKEKLSNASNGWAYTPYVDEILKDFEE